MKTVLKYLKGYYAYMTWGLIIKITGSLAELMLPYILSHILANVIGRTMRDILYWGMLMIVFSIIACVFNVIANRMAARVSSNFAENMRKDLFEKTLRLSAAQTDKFTIPSLESRITSDTYNVHNFLNMMQRMGVRAPIMLTGGIIMTLLMDAPLSLVMISMTPFIFVTIYFISKKGVPLYTRVQQSIDSMVRVVREDSQGIRVIKALSKNDYEHRRYDDANSELVKNETRAGVIMGGVHPIMMALMNMGTVLVIAIGARRVSEGLSKPETIIAFMQYFTHISMSLMVVTRMFVMYTKSAASAKRIEEVLLACEDVTVKEKENFPDIRTDAHIKFENVTFSYKGKRKNLDSISFEIPPGGKLGIIGATGCGKSTIIKLLLRFYDADEGNIYINGENIRTLAKEKLYAMFGSAQQYDFLFADTIEENIKFGRDISHEDIVKAAKISQADDFITSFEDGYNHLLAQHGSNVSGGQKQRILISRAIAAKPEILILDDSSSALDYKTDAALRKALSQKLEGTTLITVAQRVSSVKNSDIIIVVDDGKIIGMGTHEELLEKCEHYSEISRSQMGGAFVD